MAFDRDELNFLCAHPEAIAEASQHELTRTSMMKDMGVLKKTYGDYARAVVEATLARRSLEAKIGPGEWLADSDSAQQATPGAVARFRAEYLRSLGAARVTDVTCSIGTELLFSQVPAAGSDLDASRVRMAVHNTRGCSQVLGVAQADALQPVWTGTALPNGPAGAGESPSDIVIADPARRNSSGRIARLDEVRPTLPELVERYPRLVVKCAPGIDVKDVSDWAGQVDFISVGGDMKEASVYSAPVVGRPASDIIRRAVVIGDNSGTTSRDIWTSDMPDEGCDVRPVGRFIVEPDAALIRAGLVRHYGHAHGLWQLDSHIAFLSGDTVPPGVRGFEVLEQVPLRQVKAALAARGVGSAEILIRGVDLDPDVLRKKWKLKGKAAVSVIIARIDSEDQRMAFICRPVRG
ncbi:SAM-dependent methyltransferase [Corynebacterium sp. zg254]|uniref:SAM-dependent methyltransferase n=1 Tax=Corynebacterium zhongnanshanii TaxID=2768834 RepID=A0ABQ6VJC1_9CORY|nr:MULTISPECIES: SAM-dependent methyltransferase [Corynebacterium]KAB3523221.1 SAM-dependent methyltransferase [Corynebacterium zhongnanshanii]MCR5913663.1 SAM-dependent methyltransferase [Corynebacterium sp. zg254]